MILLIDEAHNLYDRVTDMYTIVLTPDLIEAILQAVEFGQQSIEQAGARIIHRLGEYNRMCKLKGLDYLRLDDLDDALLNEVAGLIKKLDNYFERLRDAEEMIPETH